MVDKRERNSYPKTTERRGKMASIFTKEKNIKIAINGILKEYEKRENAPDISKEKILVPSKQGYKKQKEEQYILNTIEEARKYLPKEFWGYLRASDQERSLLIFRNKAMVAYEIFLRTFLLRKLGKKIIKEYYKREVLLRS